MWQSMLEQIISPMRGQFNKSNNYCQTSAQKVPIQSEKVIKSCIKLYNVWKAFEGCYLTVFDVNYCK